MVGPAPVIERQAMDEHRYRFTACLKHRPVRRPGGDLACENPWCQMPLADAPRENTERGIRQLLDSLADGLSAQRRRMAAGDPLATKGVRSFDYDLRAGWLRADLGRNLVVISGRRIAGRSTFDITGESAPAQVGWVGLDTATANPTEAVTQLDTTAGNRSIKAFDAGYATITAQDVSPVKVTARASWTEADDPGPKTFIVRRVGLLNANDNTARTLYSLLGGTVAVNILALDLTGLNSFSFKPEVEVTLSNQSAQ